MVLPHNPFYFIRHGQTDWNNDHRLQGRTDIPLNRSGMIQAQEAALILNETASNPLSRAVKTAEIIAQKRNIPLNFIQELEECSLGVQEGQLRGDGQWFEKWRQGEMINGAESFASFTTRVMRGLTTALDLPGPVLIVAHSLVYMVVQKALGLPLMDLPHCRPVYHQPPRHPTHPWRRCSLENEDEDEDNCV